ncbi:hypothetical protein [Halolamina sp. C58]|uniref:hypothetical protein n=1 Tax=Halolamina sp. C58 TaxID=3421640 RepID=UPI003EBBB3D0
MEEKADSDANKDIFDLFDHDVFIPLEDGKKHSYDTGWDQKRNLISQAEAEKHLREGGNVGVVIGKWFDGITYVLFDIEEAGILPEDFRSIIDPYALLTEGTAHDGRNRIVRIESREAYNLLDSFPTTITDITEGESEDIELLTNTGTPLPPSEIDHANCSDSKDCDQSGTGRYVLQSINPEAPAMDIDSVQRLGQLLGIEPEQDSRESDIPSGNVDTEAPPVDPGINPQKEFAENVPSVSHNFEERYEYMRFGDWDGQELFSRLWNGDFSAFSGSNPQGRAECKLANYIGFFMGRNQSMIQFVMSTLPFDSYYAKYPSHRKQLLEWASGEDWVFCEGVNFDTKSDVANIIHMESETSTSDIVDWTEYKVRQVRNTIDILKAEGVVETERQGRKNVVRNIGITEGYINRLENTNQKHNPDSPKITLSDNTSQKVEI